MSAFCGLVSISFLLGRHAVMYVLASRALSLRLNGDSKVEKCFKGRFSLRGVGGG